MACPDLTVTNSDRATTAVTGSTGDFSTVTCVDGYESATDGFAFTVTCIATGAGTSDWDNGDLTCEGRVYVLFFLFVWFDTLYVGCTLCFFVWVAFDVQ